MLKTLVLPKAGIMLSLSNTKYVDNNVIQMSVCRQ